jgi:hypothetical protein
MDLDDNNCPICLDLINNISNKITLDCEHSFHKECFNKYFDTTCPICKRPFMTSNIYYINNISDSTFTNVILLHNPIIKKLNNFFSLETTLIFFKLLNAHILISGQFLLSVIQNSNEHINELDIYVDKYQYYKKIKRFLKKNHYIKINNSIRCNCTNNNLNYLASPNNLTANVNELIINNIKTYKFNNATINIVFNTNNEYTIKNLIQLDILKNYFDGNYFYIYDISKIELKIEYIIKQKINIKIKNLILYYRNIGYKVLITK